MLIQPVMSDVCPHLRLYERLSNPQTCLLNWWIATRFKQTKPMDARLNARYNSRMRRLGLCHPTRHAQPSEPGDVPNLYKGPRTQKRFFVPQKMKLSANKRCPDRGKSPAESTRRSNPENLRAVQMMPVWDEPKKRTSPSGHSL